MSTTSPQDLLSFADMHALLHGMPAQDTELPHTAQYWVTWLDEGFNEELFGPERAVSRDELLTEKEIRAFAADGSLPDDFLVRVQHCLTEDDCRNCDGRLCMDCVTRTIHEDCTNSCPDCCTREGLAVKHPELGLKPDLMFIQA